MKRAFVFVVCGAKEHIDTLNFSIKALQKQSELPILVVTDLKRNEAHINHQKGQIIDVPVSDEYNHHQASIFLKTGLHKFLPMERFRYCYLDTDVVTLKKDAEKVFDCYIPPITFATDHCRMHKFSAEAVNCGCDQMPDELQGLIDRYNFEHKDLMKNQLVVDRVLKEWASFKNRFPLEKAKNEWFDGLLQNQPALQTKRALLLKLTNPKLSLPRLLFNYLFGVLPNYRRSLTVKRWKDLEGNVLLDEGPNYHQFMNNKGFYYREDSRKWYDSSGNVAPELPKTFNDFLLENGLCYNTNEEAWYTTDGKLLLPNITKLIERNSQYWYDAATDTWYDEVNSRVFVNECNHLQDAIKKDFGVKVSLYDWQHWNGGVFLFDKNSISFLDTWHNLCLGVFSLPNWKTRDQGALITTAWKLELQNHPTLPITFNFIADYNHPTMVYEGDLSFKIKAGQSSICPSFIHIYHHWGDKDWNVWSDVENHIGIADDFR